MRAFLLFLLIEATVALSSAQSTLDHVRRAQDLLGSTTWSRAVVISNSKPGPIYPARVHALVFELNHMLWIYLPYEGTQSLSTHAGAVEADQGRLPELLQALHSGFTSVADAPAPTVGETPMSGSPRNGCFIESLAAAHLRLARGEPLLKAGILLFYAQRGASISGHAVLAYATPAGVFVDDPQRNLFTEIKGVWNDDAMVLAKSHQPRLKSSLLKARLVPVSTVSSARQVAALR
ncbi:MAG: hypothetical protein U1F61_02860 [Opitutaceae bacterium]